MSRTREEALITLSQFTGAVVGVAMVTLTGWRWALVGVAVLLAHAVYVTRSYLRGPLQPAADRPCEFCGTTSEPRRTWEPSAWLCVSQVNCTLRGRAGL